MTIQTLLEIADPFDAYARNLGYCLVKFLVAGSSTANPQFIVFIYETGQIRTVDQIDLLVYRDPSRYPIEPPIPDDWRVKVK